MTNVAGPLVQFLRDRLDEDAATAPASARAVVELEAKRQILALHCDDRGRDPSCSDVDYPEIADDCETLRALALPYAGCPGYAEATAWRGSLEYLKWTDRADSGHDA